MEEAGNGNAETNGGSSKDCVTKTLGEFIRDQHDEAAAPMPRHEMPPAEESPAKVSLMELLADRDWCSDGGEEAEEEEEWVEAVAEKGRITSVCCVCMVRNKGAAFIPCGHTFCRRCSRELWVCRGNCPLCNQFIHEILDIF